MIQTLEAFVASAQEKLKLFQNFASLYLQGLCVPDHIGYKCNSAEEFESLRTLLEQESFFLYQSYISGRRITIFKLKVPFQTSFGDIHFLELADQKLDGSQHSGLDHLEVFPLHQTFENLVEKLLSQNISIAKVDRPHHVTWDISLSEDFKLRLESEPLIEKIKKQEMHS